MAHCNIRLAYAGFAGNRQHRQDFACGIYGLRTVETELETRFRADEGMWRLAVRSSSEPGVDHIGLEFDSIVELDAAAARLRAMGYAVEADARLAATRNVYYLVRTRAPDGTHFELVVGARTAATPFASPNGARFLTGEGGLGHVLLMVPDITKALSFFTDGIGLERSDCIEVVPGTRDIPQRGGAGTTSWRWPTFRVLPALIIAISKSTRSARLAVRGTSCPREQRRSPDHWASMRTIRHFRSMLNRLQASCSNSVSALRSFHHAIAGSRHAGSRLTCGAEPLVPTRSAERFFAVSRSNYRFTERCKDD